MGRTTGLVLHFVRTNQPAQSDAWRRWLDAVWLPALRGVEDVRAATLWALKVKPEPYMPSVGFTHVITIELAGDATRGVERVRACEDALRSAGRFDAGHSLIVEDALDAHGRHVDKPLPGPDLHGHILAYVLCNDRRQEDEWDAWNDAVHMPDMLDSGGFSGLSRWVRATRRPRGTDFVTLYDVPAHGVEVAVARSAAVMPTLTAAGRKHATHIGGMTLMLVRP